MKANFTLHTASLVVRANASHVIVKHQNNNSYTGEVKVKAEVKAKVTHLYAQFTRLTLKH